jgi:Zn-dependent peptidase ImmA (M78 family)
MTTSLVVDRSLLADTAQPDQLAELLLAQLVLQLPQLLPLPIIDVATACGIVEFALLDTDAFEGGLIQDEHKKRGIILLRAGAHQQRSRYTIAHELGHFVNLRHVAPPGGERLLCNREHLRASGVGSNNRIGMEAQANEFATSLLMPRKHIAALPFMVGSPEIARILALQTLCDVSKEAAARRYAELHGGDFAVVFSKDGKLVKFPVRGGDFPWLEVKPGQPIFRDTLTKRFTGSDGDVSEQEESDPSWWLKESDIEHWSLWEEVLIQTNGYRMTLLLGERVGYSHRKHQKSWTPRIR